jgi:hypothetical protein
MGSHGGPWEPEHGRFVGWVGALAETRHGRLRNAGFGNPAYLLNQRLVPSCVSDIDIDGVPFGVDKAQQSWTWQEVFGNQV